jgi:hypothetical protein
MTLLGPDVLLLAMGGARANNAVLVLECGQPLDAARVERAVEALRPIAPFMASRLERPLPWGRLRWTARDGVAVAVERRTLGPDDRIDAVVEEILNRRVDPRREPPLAWHVIEQGEAGWLVLRWVHALMDPRGAELLVAMLDAVDAGGERAAWAAARPIVPPEDERPAKERGALARSAMGPLRALGRERPPTLARNGTAPGRVRHRRRLVRSAGRQLPQTLAAVGRAVAGAAAARGDAPAEPFIVPISVDRRKKGEPGPVFGNFVSFHFARFRPAETDAATVAALRRDMAEAVRTNFVEALWAGMNFIRYYPPRHLLRPLGGREIASFHCADTGEVRPALPALFGVAVRSAYHAPCVQPHPGLGLFFTRVGELESIVAVWIDGVVTPDEVERLLDAVERGIAAAPAA